jgi:hypothetical protein
MSEMIERVARAIYLVQAKADGWDDEQSFDLQVDMHWENCIPHARAAIAAMREPTEGMIAAWCAVGIDQDPRDYWAAGIDEVLK